MGRKRPYKRGPLPPLVMPKAPAVVVPSEPEWTPTMTMHKQVAMARREMGPERWAELNSEWL